MNNSQIATAVALRDLKCYSIDTIDDRILLQKKIFLAQDIGLPLGYGYSWYIHGPYSTDLTTVAYQIVPEGCESIEKHHFKEIYANMINKVNALENGEILSNLKMSVVQWYELVASIAYWYKRGNKCEKAIIDKIKHTKPQFTEEQTSVAYKSYVEFKQCEQQEG